VTETEDMAAAVAAVMGAATAAVMVAAMEEVATIAKIWVPSCEGSIGKKRN